ncbi:hypothetical protein N7467_005466 [Penicillium canescens]|nr:hypothetical protein N7467_005466 [Penicillium canescens]
MATSASSSSRSISQSFTEPSSDAFLESDFQTSPSTGIRARLDATQTQPSSILRQVGPDRRKRWILYETAQEDEFLPWWLETEYGQQLNGGGRSRMKWSVMSHSAEAWEYFDQVAELSSGRPKVICRACSTLLDHPQHKSHGTSAMGKHQRSISCRKGKKRASHQISIHDAIQRSHTSPSVSASKFTKTELEEHLLKTIARARLAFTIVEDPAFQSLLNLIYSDSQGLELPSAKTLRRRLRDAVTSQQDSQLEGLPSDAKVSLALDCWTSPFQQAFMAITVYFINGEWNYRELLLGFEPLHGPHTGVNLSDVLLKLLRERNLVDRIFSVTTDNATNNETLIRSVQDTLLASGVISSRESLVRVPCMAHVIQLFLKQLLGHIKAAPKNKEVTNVWSDSQVNCLRESADDGDVAHTLMKVRSFAVFINASPQRRDAFLCLQSCRMRLFPLHDVQTRWNSTFLMLRRARRLCIYIEKYCNDHDYAQFKISATEWRQIDYLLHLTQPFFQFTMALMKTKDETLEEEEALKANEEDFDLISDDEESNQVSFTNNEIAAEELVQTNVMVTEASPTVNYNDEQHIEDVAAVDGHRGSLL